jgi:putative ABC transport system substrate-binding protein
MGGAESDLESAPRIAVLKQGLERLGWTVGRNLQIDYYWTKAETAKTRTGTAELMQRSPDLLVADGTSRLIALQEATHTIPIVFILVSDPVDQGLVSSLARPGGNITGFTATEPSLGGKMLGLLKEIAPQVTRVAIVYNPDTSPASALFASSAEAAAKSLAVELSRAPVRSPSEIEAFVSGLAREPRFGMLVSPDNFTTVHRKLIIELAARHRLPAIYPFRYFVTDGGLASYGVDAVDPFGKAAAYIDRLLRGEKPADLPIQQPTKFETVLNLKTAKAMGLNLPQALLATADEVIE